MADSPMMIQQFSPKNVNAMDLEGEFELDVMDTADAGARVATPPVIPIPPPPPPPPPPTHSLKRHHNQIATASAFNVSKPTFNITTSESSKVPPSFSISMPRPPHSASGNTASSSLTVTVTPLENSVTKNIAPANLTLSTPFVLPQQPVPVAQLIKKQEQLNQPSSSPATTNNGQTGMTSAAVPLHSVQRKVVLLPSKLQPPQQQQQQQQQQNPPSVIQPHQNATQQPTVYLQQQQQQSMLAAPANAVIVQQAPQLLVQPPTPQPQENNQQPSAEDLIREQQKQIEELQQALQRSQRQLMQQTKILLDQQSQLNEANNNPQQNASQPSPADLEDKKAKNADHVKLLMNQQIQNKQLQNQIQELKAMQLKVQEHQQSVSLTLNTVAGLQQQQQQGESGSQQQQSQNQTSVAKNQVVLKPAAHVLMDRMKNNVRK